MVKMETMALKDPPVPRELMEILAPQAPPVYQDQQELLEIQVTPAQLEIQGPRGRLVPLGNEGSVETQERTDWMAAWDPLETVAYLVIKVTKG